MPGYIYPVFRMPGKKVDAARMLRLHRAEGVLVCRDLAQGNGCVRTGGIFRGIPVSHLLKLICCGRKRLPL